MEMYIAFSHRMTETDKDMSMEKSLRIYFAGDLFNHKDLAGNFLLARCVEEVSFGKYQVCLPQNGEADPDRTMDIRDEDYNLLLSCDIFLGNFDGSDLDSGTVAEFIFAKMLDMPAVLLRTDFRFPAESSASPDPWNLMCSGYPRTRSLVLHGMQLWHQAACQEKNAERVVKAYHESIAGKIIGELDKVLEMKKVFSREKLPQIYENILCAAGGTLSGIWTEKKIDSLIREKCEKGIY